MSGEYFFSNEGLRNRFQRLLFGPITTAIVPTAVTVGNVAAAKLPTTPLSGRTRIIIQNLSANMLYVGDSTVTASNGIQILPKGSIELPVEDNIDIYGICDGAGSDIRVLEGA